MVFNTKLRGVSRRQQSRTGKLKNEGSIVYVVLKTWKIDRRSF